MEYMTIAEIAENAKNNLGAEGADFGFSYAEVTIPIDALINGCAYPRAPFSFWKIEGKKKVYLDGCLKDIQDSNERLREEASEILFAAVGMLVDEFESVPIEYAGFELASAYKDFLVKKGYHLRTERESVRGFSFMDVEGLFYDPRDCGYSLSDYLRENDITWDEWVYLLIEFLCEGSGIGRWVNWFEDILAGVNLSEPTLSKYPFGNSRLFKECNKSFAEYVNASNAPFQNDIVRDGKNWYNPYEDYRKRLVETTRLKLALDMVENIKKYIDILVSP